MKIDTVFARKEATANGIFDAEYCINARLLNPEVGYRAVALSPTTLKPSRVVFRRRMSDPGKGVLTTFQKRSQLVVIGAWDGTNMKFLLETEGFQRQVFNDYKEDHKVLSAIFKENPWIKDWLASGPGAENHYLPTDLFPESEDTGSYINDLAYARFSRMYPGVSKHIPLESWRKIDRRDRHLSAVDMPASQLSSGLVYRHGAVVEDTPMVGDKYISIDDGVLRIFKVV